MLFASAEVFHDVLEDTARGVTEWRTLSAMSDQAAKDGRDEC
jgi:hypothetical protein